MKNIAYLLWFIIAVSIIGRCPLVQAFCERNPTFKKTHTRSSVEQVTAESVITPKRTKRNNWITHMQMEAHREEKWQAKRKRERDRKNEAQALVTEE